MTKMMACGIRENRHRLKIRLLEVRHFREPVILEKARVQGMSVIGGVTLHDKK